MKILSFGLLASALLLNHAGLAQTAPAQPPSASPATPAAPGIEPVPNSSPPATGGAAADMASTRKVTVSSLTGKGLTGEDNRDLGDIERVVESKADNKPYIVVSRGGLLGFFDKKYLVPIDQIAVAGDRVLAKSLTQSQIERSTSFVDDSGIYHVLEANQVLSIPEQR
jgi:hypothetical protein